MKGNSSVPRWSLSSAVLFITHVTVRQVLAPMRKDAMCETNERLPHLKMKLLPVPVNSC